jgi:hypothetical protein
MTQVVAVVLIAVAIPLAARVLVPVVEVFARRMVSVVIAIERDTDGAVINVIVVPIWKATLEFAGIVTV